METVASPLKKRGRPSRYAEYEKLLASLPPLMTKRPKYVDGIGLFRGERDISVWVKIRLPNGGTYRGRAYEPGEAAEIRLGSISSWSWEQLEAKRTELTGRAERGEPLETTPVERFRTFALPWLDARKQTVKRWKMERSTLDNSLLPFFGDMDLNTITFQDVNKWQSKQRETQAPATVQRQLNTLRTIFNDAKRAGKLQRNPCDDCQKLKGIEPRQRFLEVDEAAHLIREAAKVADWLPDFLTWLLHSGMRRGEALALTWDDVKTVGDKALVSITHTKSGKPRYITCSRDMVAILARRRETQSDSNRVFPVTLITLKRKMKDLRVTTGIKDFRLHDLRRTNATHLANAGVDLRTLSGRMGHRDLTMLHSVYSVFSRDDKAAEVAQSVFGEAKSETKGVVPEASPDRKKTRRGAAHHASSRSAASFDNETPEDAAKRASLPHK